jgi:hypothetical protein
MFVPPPSTRDMMAGEGRGEDTYELERWNAEPGVTTRWIEFLI